MKEKVKKSFDNNISVETVFILVALIFLNVMLFVHLLFGVVGIIIGFIALAFGIMFSGFVGLIIALISPLIVNSWAVEYIFLTGIHPLAVALLSIAIFCFGGLWMIGNYYIVKYFIKAMKWYFDLNVRVFKKYEP